MIREIIIVKRAKDTSPFLIHSYVSEQVSLMGGTYSIIFCFVFCRCQLLRNNKCAVVLLVGRIKEEVCPGIRTNDY
jgi:hypothetical protein